MTYGISYPKVYYTIKEDNFNGSVFTLYRENISNRKYFC